MQVYLGCFLHTVKLYKKFRHFPLLKNEQFGDLTELLKLFPNSFVGDLKNNSIVHTHQQHFGGFLCFGCVSFLGFGC